MLKNTCQDEDLGDLFSSSVLCVLGGIGDLVLYSVRINTLKEF